MKLQGRDLSYQMQGEDVGLIQDELRQLGYVIPDNETEVKVFGDATRKAVEDFQFKNGLWALGTVDGETASRISMAVAALQPQTDPFIVPGQMGQEGADQEQIQLTSNSTTGAPDPSLAELVADGQLKLPPDLLSYLERQGIHTLEDLIELVGLPPKSSGSGTQTSKDTVNLDLLTPDVEVQTLLMEKGYKSIDAISSVPRATFVTALHDELGDFRAAQLYVMARAQEDMLKNIATAELVNLANGRPTLLSQTVADDVTPCDCPGCNAAISPQAYLSDLLVYTDEHVEQITASSSLQDASQLDAGFSKNATGPTMPPPVIEPDGGVFIDSVTIFIDYPNVDYPFEIYYSIDSSATRAIHPPPPPPPNPFQLTQSATVRAVAVITFPNGQKVTSKEADATFTSLSSTFCQPFGDLPVSCDAADESVRQVRICIEVLRQYLHKTGFPPAGSAGQAAQAALDQATAAYCLAAYTTLLAQLGTSYQELQLARTADATTRQSLADRLGIEADNLDALLLVPPGTATSPYSPLNEQNLEQLFGLVDTTRDPLSGGLTSGDGQNQLANWRLDGVTWGKNTDLQGNIYVSVNKASNTSYNVVLFSDSNRSLVVAQGICPTSAGRMNLVETNQSGLTGSLDLTYVSDDSSIVFRLLPEFICWQFQRLRALWLEEDLPTDAYSNNMRPIIDPDLIGPDDFRNPIASVVPPFLKDFDIWVRRRNWVDGRLAAMGAMKKPDGTPDMDGLLTAMTPPPNGQPITYGSTTLTPWPTITALTQLDTLFGDLLQGVSVSDVIQQIEQDLGLHVDSFMRLMNLRVKDQLARGDPRNPPLTGAEWQEVYSILGQAQKVQFFPTWIAEEQTHKLVYDSSTFWISISEPKVGEWPPSQGVQPPLIDPEILELSDLPDPVAGQQARSFWLNRKNQLSGVYASLKTTREQNGLNAALLQALGNPNPGDPLPHHDDLDQLESDLHSNDPQKVKAAGATIIQDLYMSVDTFDQMMAIRAKDQNPNPLLKPTAAEWGKFYAILTTAQKLKRLYPTWGTEEQTAALAYWQALKAHLPPWRSRGDDRQAWQQALLTRSISPMIDPDLIDVGYLQILNPPNPALALLTARQQQVSGWLTALQQGHTKGTNDLQWFSQSIQTILGVQPQDLSNLNDWQNQGNDITARLAQLNLSRQAFTYLVRIYSLLTGGAASTILDSEWDDVSSILVQVQKQQSFGQWRRQEQGVNLTLSPDYFQLPGQSDGSPASSLPAWRAAISALTAWQVSLQARIDERSGRIASLQDAVDGCEEATLSILRDALVMAFDPTQSSLATNAVKVTETLLIDASTASTQMTTRIDQAIETIQNLLFSLRTGELTAPPSLRLNDADFDQFWVWLGTYANWSAALRVFLYPENVLQPTLRNWQSPGFANLLSSLPSSQQITPKQARDVAQTYLDYFHDVGSLVVDATCYANSLTPSTPGLLFMFAHSSPTNNFYWSRWDPQDMSSYAQTPWRPISGLDDTYKIIGVVPYTPSSTSQAASTQGFIYLFASRVASGQPILVFTRYSLDSGYWDPKLTQIELPPDATSSAEIVVRQSYFSPLASPQLTLWTGTGVTLYQLSFDSDGTATNQWRSFLVQPAPVALVQLCANVGFLIAQAGDGDLYMNPGELNAWKKIGTGQFISAFTWPSPEKNYVFALTTNGQTKQTSYWVTTDEGAGNYTFALHPLPSLSQLVYSASCLSCGGVEQFACTLEGEKGWFRVHFNQNGSDYSLTLDTQDRIVPYVSQAFQITEQLSSQQLQNRKAIEQQMFQDNAGASEGVLGYLREAHYFVPVYVAQQLQQSGQYTSALDWYRVVYDYSQPLAQRKIYYGLEAEGSSPQGGQYSLGDDWLLDPLDPHSIAATRGGTYTRFTLLSLVNCFLDYADAEYTRDTAESVSLARTLYMTAQNLLTTPDLQQSSASCSAIIAELAIAPDDSPSVSTFAEIKQRLTSIANVATLRELVPHIKAILANTHMSREERFSRARSIAEAAVLRQPAAPTLGAVLAAQGRLQSRLYADLLQNQAVLQEVSETGSEAGTAFLQEVASISKVSSSTLLQQKVELPWLSQNGASFTALARANANNGSSPIPLSPEEASGGASSSLLVSPLLLQERYIAAPPYQFCIPANPVLQSLSQRADNNLAKIRSGRNIAGLVRQLQLTSSTGITTTGDRQGQVVTFQPTPYRYATLIDRAKQLAQLANQAEAAMLSALEKRDNEEYSLLKARQDLGLAQANVQLQQLKLSEAGDGVALAQSQESKAQMSFDYYRGLLEAGKNQYEQDQLSNLGTATDFTTAATVSNIAVGGLEVVGGVLVAIYGGPAGIAAGAGLIAQGLSTGTSGAFSSQASHNSAAAAYYGAMASYERRAQEWAFQESLANQDIAIGQQQITIARDGVVVATQEWTIAQMQTDNDAAIVNFLATKFTNADLYDWMSRVLSRVYRFFLQQATAMAQQASNQLAFERAQTPPPFIQSGYWQPPSPNATTIGGSNLDSTSTDRNGLTGSARLLQDIYQLDQYAFTTDQLKLQLTKTISLSTLAPAEFQRFRETGVMTFSTPLRLFDADFPGHYLRQIKRVRTTVIALIPPNQGIHASLASSGVSRIVVGGDSFQTVVMRRDPEIVALTSPMNATGIFDLTAQSTLLNPFEDLGVDMTWGFSMPMAANLFDYSTIADVLISIDYTALDSTIYRQQVVRQLDRRWSADMPFSFRQQFADQWFDLNNPDQSATPMTVSFSTLATDFPPNLTDLKIQQVLLYFARAAGQSFEIPVTSLLFTPQNGRGHVGGGATSIDGTISTRRGNADSWLAMIGKSPAGIWELTLPETPAIRNHFQNEEITDILLVITYAGQTPAWPYSGLRKS